MTDDDTDTPQPKPQHTPWHKGMPTPNPKGRGKGNVSKWSREIVENAFLHFREHPEALDRLYEENIVAYVKTIFELIPKEMRFQLARPLESMSDVELQLAAEREHESAIKLIEHVKTKVGAEIVETAARELTGEVDDEDGDGA